MVSETIKERDRDRGRDRETRRETKRDRETHTERESGAALRLADTMPLLVLQILTKRHWLGPLTSPSFNFLSVKWRWNSGLKRSDRIKNVEVSDT